MIVNLWRINPQSTGTQGQASSISVKGNRPLLPSGGDWHNYVIYVSWVTWAVNQYGFVLTLMIEYVLCLT